MDLNRPPIRGMSPRIGTFETFLVCVIDSRPPRMTVVLSGAVTTVSTLVLTVSSGFEIFLSYRAPGVATRIPTPMMAATERSTSEESGTVATAGRWISATS